MNILMLSGKAGAGKDCIANYLIKNHPYKRIAFADELKNYTAKKYNVNLNLFYTQEGKALIYKDSKTYRDLLIEEGRSKRQYDPDFWTNIVINKILQEQVLGTYKNIVISDWRFPNEYYKIKEKFKYVSSLRINRPGISFINDISETSLDSFKFDYTINNKSTKEDLYKSIEELIITKEFME